ncbi:hypothetical protein [Geotalea daltonii]|nr:hypothetical protein [Geotalea daltonii]
MSKCLECITDHATKVAETVIYIVRARISTTPLSDIPCLDPRCIP